MNHSIARIRIAGFASLRDVTLEPGPLTVLVGPNGSGKSNLLGALRMVAFLQAGGLGRFVGKVGGASALLHRGPKRTPVLELEFEFEQASGRNLYAARLGYAAGDRLVFLDEQVGWRQTGATEMRVHSLGAGHWESRLREAAEEGDTTARTVRWWLDRVTFFYFHDTSSESPLRTQTFPEKDRYLRSDGGNLAAYLARLQRGETRGDRKAWVRIKRIVGRIAPGVAELSPTPAGPAVRLDWLDDQGERYGAHQLSDGSLRAIALVTALAHPEDRLPLWMSIDEPELGLHPAPIAIVAELARSVSHRTQVLFATQSPAFLDHFEPEEVVVAEREAGETRLRRLDPEALRDWLADYTLSELFDKGVLGGRP